MKNNSNYILLLVLFALSFTSSLFAQTKDVEDMWKKQQDSSKIDYMKPNYLELDEDKILQLLDRQPNFGMYKDNYFSTGVPVNKRITNQSADAKFQISIRQRLLSKVMPHYAQLMLIYTQKSFWDIYANSFPFADNNYNPGLLLTVPVIQENKLKGVASLSIEHESNGKDGNESRSWNFITLSGVYFRNISFSFQAKIWYGLVSNDNPDLLKYKGYGQIISNYRSFDNRFGVSLLVNPCSKGVNSQLEFNFKPGKRANEYLFLQWYQGYGESLLEYNRYSSMVRIGICLKPPLRDLY